MYKKGTYIAFMTNKPIVHLNEMFGHNDLADDEFEKVEYVGFIKSVIGDDAYLVFTVRPCSGFRCTVPASDVLHAVDVNDLDEDERGKSEMLEFTAPNVYEIVKMPQAKRLEKKCEKVAKEALKALFPQLSVESITLSDSYYQKSSLLKKVDFFLNKFCAIARQDLIDEKKAKRENFEQMLQEMKFKEYHELMVGIWDNEEHTEAYYISVVVDVNFEEVVILRDIHERTRFYNSLGPDYDLLYHNYRHFLKELMW